MELRAASLEVSVTVEVEVSVVADDDPVEDAEIGVVTGFGGKKANKPEVASAVVGVFS